MELCPYCKSKGYHGEVFTSSTGSLRRCLNCEKDITGGRLSSSPILSNKKGKVILCTIHGRKSVEGADKHLFAVGKPKGRTYFQWWEHEPGIAPSRDLVTFTKENNRKGRLEGWFERYTESLLEEWSNREDSIQSFMKLIKWLNSGLNVSVSCYCDSAKRPMCHLSILRGILEDLGYLVEEAEPIKYR